MKNIVFFDLNIIGISRYPLQIANEINKLSDRVFFYFLYEEDPSSRLSEILIKLPKNSKVIKIKKPNYIYIKNLLVDINPISLLVMAQRIPDTAIISIANELNIDTYKFQHGLYIPFMKRSIGMFFSKIKKTFRYLKYSLVIAEAIKENKYKVLFDYIDIFIKGKKLSSKLLPYDKINAQKVFVYGEYWKDYHIQEFMYRKEQQITVGYPDLSQLDIIKKQFQENAVCYICQSLVEDGRLSRDIMLEFMNILSNNIGDKKLYLKLHPRSDISLYEIFKDNDNVVLTSDFPNCNKYIGHYSSLIAMSMYLTDSIFLWEFKNHNEYPFYFTENVKHFSSNDSELKDFLECEVSESNKNYIIDYFYCDNISPITKIADFLLK